VSNHRWCWLVLLAMIPLGLVLWDRIVWICGTCHTDLEIEFTVADELTGRPVGGATIVVKSEGGFNEDAERGQCQLVTGTDGAARQLCRDCWCGCAQSGLGFTNRRWTYLPWWRFRASSPKYRVSKWIDLNVPEYVRQVQQVDSGPDRLEVRIVLSAEPAEANEIGGNDAPKRLAGSSR
jgi:hypothetical protein